MPQKKCGKKGTKSSRNASNGTAFTIEYKSSSIRIHRQVKRSATDAETLHETLTDMVPVSIKDRVLQSDFLPELNKVPVSPNLPVQEVEKQSSLSFD